MSAWGEMRRRSAGKLTRKEDQIIDFRELYPEKLSVNPIKLDMSGFVDALNKLKKENLRLNKSLKKLKEEIKKINYECMG